MFKKLLLTLASLFILSGVSIAEDVTIAWTANTEDDLSGYNIWQSTNGTTFSIEDSVLCAANDQSCCEWTALNLPNGHYWWKLTAFDIEGNESGFSNTVDKDVSNPVPPDTTPPDNPTGVRFK